MTRMPNKEDNRFNRLKICRTLVATLLIVMISGCSQKDSLELVHVSAEITDEGAGIGVMDGDKKIGEIKSTSLLYEIVVKNVGGRVGDFMEPIKVQLQPNEELLSVLEQTVGSNIFDVDKRLGWSYQGPIEIKPNEQGRYIIRYGLGGNDTTGLRHGVKPTPSQKQLNEIQQHALNATLVIYLGDKIVARLQLEEFQSANTVEDAEKYAESQLGMDLIIPKPDGMFVSGISIQYPPKNPSTGKTIGDLHTVNVGYSLDQGTLIELTQEQIDSLKERQQPEIIYGPYDTDKRVISIAISNHQISLSGQLETVEISNTLVRYETIEREDITFLTAEIHPKEGSYLVSCYYRHGLTEDECFKFIRSLVGSLEKQ